MTAVTYDRIAQIDRERTLSGLHELLNELHDFLNFGVADQDCDCEWRAPGDHLNPCEACVARDLLKRLAGYLEPQVRPVGPVAELQRYLIRPEVIAAAPKRADVSISERVFVEEWYDENNPSPCVNRGVPVMWYLMRGDKAGHQMPTQREMDAATAVIQWLGTNCGHSFLTKCLRRCREEQKSSDQIRRVARDAQHRASPEARRATPREKDFAKLVWSTLAAFSYGDESRFFYLKAAWEIAGDPVKMARVMDPGVIYDAHEGAGERPVVLDDDPTVERRVTVCDNCITDQGECDGDNARVYGFPTGRKCEGRRFA